MQPFTRLDALVVPLDRANVDTDAIIPKQFMKSIKRTGFGANLFDEWRYLDHGEPGQDAAARQPNPAFPLNQPRYAGGQILLARENFGCGSSREHAAWALADFGFRALIAPSFADIFYGNCFKNSMLPVRLPERTVDALFDAVARTPGLRIEIDLQAQTVRPMLPEGGEVIAFEIEAERKRRLLNGLDDVSLTLEQAERIRSYERERSAREPWLFD
ncbi:3-isopropylmalate dehydratase small subunit [Burkholderia pseudomultivorans]|uniref:3-isopropylmalate dehydratase small subunit n=1 Tax=Burkholderia pseudomultivorans TaxID=1207504 RepID=UPI002873F838|nr:3-isopropylmalate dehydratase small subunit [Burkholderia pseudomultivorans]MDS0859661.1 3-isopropylmalate dehydratase small subunit [Burkholderia pseudomultivorans]